jgi:cell division protein ZapA (FtsZ GTPase activity inhibitor)
MVTERKQATLVIAGRSYPVQIDPSEEGLVDQVVSEVNRRVEEFQQRYPKQDKQDLLAMASLTLATELHKLRHTGEMAEMHEVMAGKIDRIESLLDGLLS